MNFFYPKLTRYLSNLNSGADLIKLAEGGTLTDSLLSRRIFDKFVLFCTYQRIGLLTPNPLLT